MTNTTAHDSMHIKSDDDPNKRTRSSDDNPNRLLHKQKSASPFSIMQATRNSSLTASPLCRSLNLVPSSLAM
jgi:hypothetical protein